MHKFATYFSVIFLLLALSLMFSALFFNMPLLLSGNKIVLLVGVALFFIAFKDRVMLYLENYRREKQI